MANELIVMIPTAGRTELLRRTLTSLSECRKPASYRETIVVENGPKGGAEEVVSSYRSSLGARYVYVSRGNKSHALNTGLEMVKECLIFFTDDDVRIHLSTLCTYAAAGEGIEKGQFYGGPVGVDYECNPPKWLIDFLPPSARGWHLGDKVTPISGAAFLGCNWAAFAQDLRYAGGFNIYKGPGAVTDSLGQEMDMQGRLLRNGIHALYIPEAMVWHYVPAKRCSPKWAAMRAYRTGIQYGIGDVEPVSTVLGFPRWMLRKWLEKGFKALIRSVNSDMRARFDAYYQFCFFCGYIRGSLIARRGRLVH